MLIFCWIFHAHICWNSVSNLPEVPINYSTGKRFPQIRALALYPSELNMDPPMEINFTIQFTLIAFADTTNIVVNTKSCVFYLQYLSFDSKKQYDFNDNFNHVTFIEKPTREWIYRCCMFLFNMGLLSNMQDCVLRMHQECRERFPRQRGLSIPTCIRACAWRTCLDACRGR